MRTWRAASRRCRSPSSRLNRISRARSSRNARIRSRARPACISPQRPGPRCRASRNAGSRSATGFSWAAWRNPAQAASRIAAIGACSGKIPLQGRCAANARRGPKTQPTRRHRTGFPASPPGAARRRSFCAEAKTCGALLPMDEKTASTKAFIGLGANLGDPEAQVRRAFAALAELPGTRLLAASSLYRSAPVGYTAQPDLAKQGLGAEALLRELLATEARFERVRQFPNAPRTLD